MNFSIPSISGAIVIVLISAISLIFFIKSIEGLVAKAGWAPSFSGLMKGPSR